MLGFYNYTVVLTYLSLCSGITGIYLTLVGRGHPGLATVCLLISGLLDAFDGKVARTRTQSTDQEKRFGIQIDSLCDPVFCLFVLAALIRLAYFNVTEEDRQKETAERRKNYQGLPVTSISLIMPLFFLLAFTPVREYLQFVFLGVLLLTAAAFVTRSIKIKKPNSQGLIVMVVIGLVELTILLLLKFRVFC